MNAKLHFHAENANKIDKDMLLPFQNFEKMLAKKIEKHEKI
jgi:hypothetical protein